MDTPQYILALLDEELRRVQRNLLERVACHYELPVEEMAALFLCEPLQLIPNHAVNIVVKKEVHPRPVPKCETRCMARVWNRGKGGQCTRKRKGETEFCAQHQTDRKHGTMHDQPPHAIFPKTCHVLYK
jgi:hypothetical protein